MYLKGLLERDISKLELAKTLFPFEREILIGPAQLHHGLKFIDDNTLGYYKEALKYDPYSIQFLGVYIQLGYALGNKNEALMNKQKLKMIGPNSNVLRHINVTMKGLN